MTTLEKLGETPPSTAELVAAVRAELSDMLDDVSAASRDGRQVFGVNGRSALKRMQRVQQLLTLIEQGAKR